jgi:hypothetical protein
MILDGQKIKGAILVALADPEMVSILDYAMYQSKSVNDIIRETSIPHTTAYRKIKWLLDEKLLVVDKISISADGKKYSLFQSMFRSISVSYENAKVTINVERNIDPTTVLTERFFSFKE